MFSYSEYEEKYPIAAFLSEEMAKAFIVEDSNKEEEFFSSKWYDINNVELNLPSKEDRLAANGINMTNFISLAEYNATLNSLI